jgi:hypothetical protein
LVSKEAGGVDLAEVGVQTDWTGQARIGLELTMKGDPFFKKDESREALRTRAPVFASRCASRVATSDRGAMYGVAMTKEGRMRATVRQECDAFVVEAYRRLLRRLDGVEGTFVHKAFA